MASAWACAFSLSGCATQQNTQSASPILGPASTGVPHVVTSVPPTRTLVRPEESEEPSKPQFPPQPVSNLPNSLGLTPLVRTQPIEASVTAPAQAPIDLWSRIRRNLSMNDVDDADRVAEWEHWYASRPDYIERMTRRAERYLFYVVEEIEKRKMPTELALLPFIESAFNPEAVSSAKAAGMWQFMPATGRTFDLTQNLFRDERRDVLESTRAALDYLEKLHRMFGDWHLALAAYNWGEGNVMRAIKKAQAIGNDPTYQGIRMPNETRHYVPKLQAVENLVRDPEKYGISLPMLPNHPFFDVVSIEKDIDVELAAELAQVDLGEFKALNPSLKYPIIFAEGNPKVLMPWENVTVFETNLQAWEGPLASWTAWVAPSNMKVSEIAKRVGMSELELRRINNIPAGRAVKAGSTLLVKRGKNAAENVSSKIAESGQLILQAEVRLRKARMKARSGETVALMARRVGVSADSLSEWNRLKPTHRLQKGQMLTVYLPVKPKATTAKKKKPSAKKKASQTAKNP